MTDLHDKTSQTPAATSEVSAPADSLSPQEAAPSDLPFADKPSVSVDEKQSGAAPEAAEAKADSATVLGSAEEKAPETKAEEAAPEKAAEEKPFPTYEQFKLPEGITVEDEKLAEFSKDLGEFERQTGADNAEVQKLGQKLLDKYVAETSETLSRLNDYYTSAWEKQKNDWKDAFESDAQIGGNRKETTMKAATTFIRTYGGDAEQQAQLRDLMNTTGVGNHPALIRLLANAGSVMAEGKPLPASKPPSTPQSKVDKRYGKI